MVVKVVGSSLDKVKGSQGGNRGADITRSLFIETKKKTWVGVPNNAWPSLVVRGSDMLTIWGGGFYFYLFF